MKAAAGGAKQNYAQAKFAKVQNAYDSMNRAGQIYTDMSQLPNQEQFFVPAGNQGYYGGGPTNAQTLADV